MSDVRDDSCYDPYRALASAIVEQATKDLREELKRLQKADKKLETYQSLLVQCEQAEIDNKEKTLSTFRREATKAQEHRDRVAKALRELEEFFWSDWCVLLSDLDGPALLEEIESEYGYGGRR